MLGLVRVQLDERRVVKVQIQTFGRGRGIQVQVQVLRYRSRLLEGEEGSRLVSGKKGGVEEALRVG